MQGDGISASPPPPFPKTTRLVESDVLGVLAEALAADVQRVLADDGVAIAAHTAGEMTKKREG